MDRLIKIVRHTGDELAKTLPHDAIMTAGDDIRTFETSAAWFRLQQLIESERKSYTERVMQGNANMTTMSEVNFAQGVEFATNRFYDAFDKILQEAARARNE